MEISREDYLRAMFELHEMQPGEGFRSVELARSLGISKPSVSAMFEKMKESRIIKKEPYKKAFLTNEGLKKAKKIMKKHRVIEVFLKDTLGYDLDTVHDEAHRLEHAFSEESIRRLDEFLDLPDCSPSGKVIPR